MNRDKTLGMKSLWAAILRKRRRRRRKRKRKRKRKRRKRKRKSVDGRG
jgi:hypothetical protein